MDFDLFECLDGNNLDKPVPVDTIATAVAATLAAERATVAAKPVKPPRKRKAAATASVTSGGRKQTKIAFASVAASAVVEEGAGTTEQALSQPALLPPRLTVHELTLGGKPRPKMRLFRAVYPRAKQLCDALAAIRAILKEIRLEFDESKGLTVLGLAESRVLLVSLHVPRSAFIAFEELGGGNPTFTSIIIHAIHFFEIRSDCSDDFTLTFNRLLGPQDDENLTIQVHSARLASRAGARVVRSVPQRESELDDVPEIDPRQFYQFRIVLKTSVLTKLIRQFKERFFDTSFKLSSGGLDIMAIAPQSRVSDCKFIGYTPTTVKDVVLNTEEKYDVYNDELELPDSEREMFAAIDNAPHGLHYCHLDRLVRRVAACPHLSCIADTQGRQTCVRHGGGAGQGTTATTNDSNFGEIGAEVGSTTAATSTTSKTTVEEVEESYVNEAGTGRMSSLDFIRFRTRFLAEALEAVQDSDYVELFIGRMQAPRDELFCPMLIRGRVLDEQQQRALITCSVTVAPKYDDK